MLAAGDPVLIEQVIANILDNAAKYSEPGTAITIRGQEGLGTVVLTIADEGPGIPAADRDKVFDMFYRVRAGDGQKAGTGLGLAICRGILEAHGGSIKAQSAKADGSGTEIVVMLPASSADAAVACDGVPLREEERS